MKTNLDKIDYKSIYDYSPEELRHHSKNVCETQKLLKKYNIVIVKGE